ncbi:MAG: YggS family pyridoxal phosphate-dependent enzyme [Clostridia bacterium]|nr:YggS family pyridoxal phosphate-dependent enzyme [Clostridia bacterium]
MNGFEYIKNNLADLNKEISELAEKVGHKVTLVAVTKSGSDEELLALAGFGAADIGENRPQELRRRGDLLKEAGYTPSLHEIGNLQRNKVKMIAESVTLIHSLDSYELAKEIDRQAGKYGRIIPVLIEINSAEEAQKGGIMPTDAIHFCKSLSEFKNIAVSGLMTMGPVCEEPEEIRPYFRRTKELFDKMKSMGLFEGEAVLSMGMSDSYRVAIEEGSTLVRVGRRLFIKD